MSHELRTPLNSILILGQQLAREPRRQPDRQAGRVRQDHPLVGHRPAEPHQRHPRPVEDRVGHGHGRRRGDLRSPTCATRRAHLPPRGRDRRASTFDVEFDPRLPRVDRSPTPSACSRSSRTCCPTPSSSPTRATCALQRRGRRRRLERRPPGAAAGAAAVVAFAVVGHRHRHPAGEAADHLRGVPAGRRRHQPQVRRHRPGPGDQPRAGQPARRRDPAAQHARQRQHVHALPAAALRRARRRRPASPASSAAPVAAPSSPRVAAGGAPRSRSPDDRDDLAAGRRGAADRRGRPALRARPARPGARQGLQGARRDARRRRRCRWRAQYQPTAISLDVFLPDMLGWTVLNQLKHDPATRHIPVQIVTLDEERQHGLAHGAFSFLDQAGDDRGPRGGASTASRTSRTPRTQAAAGRRGQRRPSSSASSSCSATTTSRSTTAGTGARGARQRCASEPFDCVRARPAAARHDRLRAAGADPATSRRCATCRSSSSPARSCRRTRTRGCTRWPRASSSRTSQSPERLLDETALFLHRVVADLPPTKQQMLERLHGSDEVLRGRKVLVVDDDVAQHLRADQRARAPRHGRAHAPPTGREAIELLESDARHQRSC